MKPTNKLLGLAGIIAAPFLMLQMMVSGKDNAAHTSLGGLFDLIYMLGWMCSIVGLMRLQATGTKKRAVVLLRVQIVLLCIANIWNLWVIAAPTYQPTAFFVLDLFWPLSNVCMLVTGIVVVLNKKLNGWKRFIPLIMGLWLPVAMITLLMLGRTQTSFFIGGLYSAIAWSVLGWMIYSSESEGQTINIAV